MGAKKADRRSQHEGRLSGTLIGLIVTTCGLGLAFWLLFGSARDSSDALSKTGGEELAWFEERSQETRKPKLPQEASHSTLPIVSPAGPEALPASKSLGNKASTRLLSRTAEAQSEKARSPGSVGSDPSSPFPAQRQQIEWDQEEVEVSYVEVDGRAVVDTDMLMPLPTGQMTNQIEEETAGSIEPGESEGKVKRSGGRKTGRLRLRKPQLWQDGVIPVAAGAWQDQPDFQVAVATLNAYTNLEIVPHSGQPDYVALESGQGCMSYVGRIGGRQPIILSDACKAGNIMHELLHTAGLFHEHMRFDRDQFIQILWENVDESYANNFQRVSEAIWLPQTDFDLYSIMMYGSTAFSVDGQSYTILTIDDQWFGQNRQGLSELDIQKIQALYPK